MSTPESEKNYNFARCKNCNGKAMVKYAITWTDAPNRIYECSECGIHYLDYLDNDADPDTPPAQLSDKDFAYIDTLLQSNEERFRWQSELVSRYLSEDSPKILDIGSGGGKFLALMREKGATPMGIEPNGVRVAFARDKYGIELDQHLVDHGYWQRGHSASIDIASLWDVIEHVNFPKKVLEDATNLLRPGGYLFIDTPTRDSIYYRLGALSYRISGGRWPFLLRAMYSPTPFAHKQIFTGRQLTKLLESVGMNVVRVECFHELSFPYGFYLRNLLGSERLANMLVPLVRMFFVLFRVRNKMLIVARK